MNSLAPLLLYFIYGIDSVARLPHCTIYDLSILKGILIIYKDNNARFIKYSWYEDQEFD